MMKDNSRIKGAGGSKPSSSTREPVVAPDSIQSRALLSILDLLGEGQIKGLVNGAQSIFLNGTSLENPDGSKNFEGFSWDFRDGKQDQDLITGFPNVSTPFNIGVQIKQATPYTFTVSDNDADFVNVIMTIPALSSQNATTGDVSATQVQYQFTMSVDNGPFNPINVAGTTSGTVIINDKSRSKYQRQHNIPLPKPGSNYRIRITRITPDSTSSLLLNDTYIDSYYEVLDHQLTYPNSVMCGIKINAEQLNDNPSRSYLVDGLYVQIPSNYNPDTRTYTGIWDGSFKIGYTNNPAWILRDLLLNKRYGLGEFINASQVNSAKLYTIARYCDGMVTDGKGGQEPRFTINTVIAAQRDAYKVIQDICSVFRGMSYWANGAVQVTQDSPADAQFLYNNSNVIDGVFNRTGSARKDRHSVVHVTWNDPLDQYKQKIEYVEDKDLINKLGYRKLDTVAFGCTSRAQAHRIGLWILYTESVETNVMTFEVGFEGVQCAPGDIVKIQDQYKAGKRNGGRLKASSRTGCTLDATVNVAGGSKIAIKMPDGKFEEVAVNQIGETDTLTFVTQLSVEPKPNATWIITEPNLVPQLARVVGVSQSDTPGQFVISVVDHNPSKYASIEQGLNLESQPTTILDPTNSNPEFIKIEEFTYLVAPGQLGTKLEVSWEGKSPSYYVSWRANSGAGASGWVRTKVSKPAFTLENVSGGVIYDFKVVGISVTGKLSSELVGTYTTLGTLNPPKAPTDLTAVGDFRQIILNWVNSGDVDFDYVEIFENTVDDVDTAYYLDRTPSNTYTRTGIPGLMKYWYWVRTVNKRGMVSDFNSEAGVSAIAGLIAKTDLEEELAKPIEDISDIKIGQEELEQAMANANSALDNLNTEVDLVQGDLANIQADVANQMAGVNATLTDVNGQITGIKNTATALQTQVNNNLAATNTAIGNVNTEITNVKNTATALQTQVNNNKTAIEGTVSGLQTQVTNNKTAIEATAAGLQTQVNTILDATEYDKNKAYTKDQFIRVGRSLYQAKINVPANAAGTNAPPNGTYWRDAGSVVSSADGLAARVTTAETNIGTINGTLTSQASTINGIQTTLNGKADASALTALTTRVTAAEGVNTSQGTAITNLTNSVAGKADASAVNALTTRVTAAEGTITSQGNSLTSVQATLGNIAGNGSNMVPAQYSWLTSATLPTTPLNTGTTVVGVAVAEAISGFGYKFTAGSNSAGLFFMLCPSNNAAGYNIPIEPGIYLVSFYASTTTGASIRANLWNGASRYTTTTALSATRTRYSLPVTVTDSAKIAVTLYPNVGGVTGTEVIIDSVMLEKRIGESNVASPFVAGPTASQIAGLASATSALDARVTAAEGVNTSQATSITNLNTSLASKADASALATKADASALNALTTRVTTAEGNITSQGNSITSLNNSLAGKADVSAVNALTTRVTAAEDTLTSQGNSLTSVQATLGNIGGAGSNMLPAEYNVFAANPPVLSSNAVYSIVGDADAATFNGYALKITALTSANGAMYFVPSGPSSITYAHANMGFKRGKYILSYYARSAVAGHTIAPFLKSISSDGSSVNSTIVTQNQALTTSWTRYSAVIDMTSATHVGDMMLLCLQTNVSAVANRIFWLDKIMIEPMIGENTSPSAFVLGDSFRQTLTNATANTALEARVTAAEGVNTSQSSSITTLTNNLADKADASALTALNNTVTQQGSTLTAQGSQITTIQTGLNALPQENLMYDPDFTDGRNAFPTVSNVTITNVDRTDASAPAAAPSPRLLKFVYAASSTGNIYQRTAWPVLLRDTTGRLAVQEGEVYDVSFTVYREGTSDRQFGIWVQPYSLNGTSINHGWLTPSSTSITGVNGQWVTISGSITIPATAVSLNITLRASIHAEPLTVWVGRPVIQRRSVQARNQADATSALSARVTDAEGTITSQGSAITGLNNSLAGKADASALTALTTRVTAAEGVNTSQGNSITSLNNSVAGKADTTALNALTTRVTTAENSITSQSNSITSLTASMDAIGGTGTNLVPAEYSTFGATKPDIVYATSLSETVVDAQAFNGYALKVTSANTSTSAAIYLSPTPEDYASANIACKPGKYILSYYAKTDTAGHTIAVFARTRNSAGSAASSAGAPQDALTTSWQRYSSVVDLTGSGFADKDKMIVGIQINRSGVAGRVIYLDRFMLEPMVGSNTAPSVFVPGNSLRQAAALGSAVQALDVRLTSAEGVNTSQATSITNLTSSLAGKADASALTALTTRVTAAEGVNTTQANSITSLNTSMANTSQDNLLRNPDFNAAGDLISGTADFPIQYFSKTDAGVPAAAPANRLLCMSKAGNVSGWGGNALYFTNGSNRTAATPGEVLNVECQMYCENATLNAGKIAITYWINGSTSVNGNVRILGYDMAAGGWQKLSVQVTVPAQTTEVSLYLVPDAPAVVGFKMWVANLSLSRQNAAERSLATATQALDTRVTAAEGTLTSQGSSITSLNNTVAGKADTSALNALTTRVTAAEGVNTSQGTSITNLNTSVSAIGGAGTNLVPAEYACFMDATVPPMTYATNVGTVVADPQGLGGFVYKTTSVNTTNSVTIYTVNGTDVYENYRMPFKRGKYIISFYAKAETAGHQVSLFLRAKDAAGGTANPTTVVHTLTTDWARYSVVVDHDTSAYDNKDRMSLGIQFNRSGVSGRVVYWDRFMVEPMIGSNSNPSVFVPGSSYIQTAALGAATQSLDSRVTAAEGTLTSQGSAITNLNNSLTGKADASALTALTTRVTAAEGVNTSQGTSITNLNNSVNAIGGTGSNMMPAEYSAFTSDAPVTSTNSAYSVGVEADVAAFSGYAFKVTTNNTTNSTMYFAPSAGSSIIYAHANMGFKRTKYILSYYAKAAVAGHTIAPFLKTIRSSDNASVNSTISSQNQALTTDWVRYSAVIDMTSASHVGDLMMLCLQTNVSVTSGRTFWLDKIMIEEAIGSNTAPSVFEPGNSFRQSALNASAVTALTTRVTAAEGVNTSQGTAITSLNNSIGNKADVSALNALTTRVTTAEGTISSQGTSLTNVSATLGNIAGNGSNLLASTYSWVTSTSIPATTVSNASRVGVAVAEATSGFGYKATSTTTNSGAYLMLAPSNSAAGWNLPLDPGTYICSFYASSPNGSQVQLSMYDGAQRMTSTFNIGTTRARYSGVITVTAATKVGYTFFFNRNGVVGTEVTIDSVMIERQIAGGTEPSVFAAGPIAAEVAGLATAQTALDARVTAAEGVNTTQATQITNLTTTVNGKADASALTALTTRVTTAENNITSQSGSITNLTSSLGNIATENFIEDPTFATSTGMTNTSSATVVQRADAPVGCPSGRAVKWSVAQSTGNNYSGFIVSPNVRFGGSRLHDMMTTGGEVYDFEVYIYSTVAARVFGIWVQQYDAANASIGHTWATTGGDGVQTSQTANAWVKVTGTWTVAPDCLRVAMNLRVSAGSAGDFYISKPSFTKRSGQLSAQAAAIQTLDTRVTTAEGTLTSQGSAITSLNNTVANKADTSALNALTTRVTTAEGTITSQGNAVTALQSTVGGIGGSGSNLNPSEYSVFGPNKPTIGAISTGLTYDTVVDSAALGGYALKFATSSTSTTVACYLHTSNVVGAVGSFPISYDNSKYILSFYAKASVAGHQIRAFTRYVTSTATVGSTTSALFSLTTGWVRYSMVIDMTNATTFSGTQMAVALQPNVSGVSGRDIFFDRIMIEKQIGTNTTPSTFEAGTSYTQAQAQATALNSLTTRVTTAEGNITSQASSISTLQSSVGTNTASISTTSTALSTLDGKLSASWTAKVQVSSDGTQYFAGMGIGIQNTSQGITQSQIAFQADRIVMINPGNSNAIAPFQVVGGIVRLNVATIAAATITTAHIADAAITYAKIGTAQIADTHIMNGHITNAKIQDLAVDTIKIAGNAVTIPYYAQVNGNGGATAVISYPAAVNLAIIVTANRSSKYIGGQPIYINLYNSAGTLLSRVVGGYTNGFYYQGDYNPSTSCASYSFYVGAGSYYVTVDSDAQSSYGITIIGAMK
jgi:predicted phage tail protein